ncbi:MAG: hypothetical protein FWF97_02795 [Alphaproteobacteria bacterium]|nr:hypothetical protein [Alphaproteobacteria bacterium]
MMCVKCGADNCKKYGRPGGRQRFMCKTCGRSFYMPPENIRGLNHLLAKVGLTARNVQKSNKLQEDNIYDTAGLLIRWHSTYLKKFPRITLRQFLQYEMLSPALTEDDFLSLCKHGEAYMSETLCEFIQLRCPYEISLSQITKMNRESRRQWSRKVNMPADFASRFKIAVAASDKDRKKIRRNVRSDGEKQQFLEEQHAKFNDWFGRLSPQEQNNFLEARKKYKREESAKRRRRNSAGASWANCNRNHYHNLRLRVCKFCADHETCEARMPEKRKEDKKTRLKEWRANPTNWKMSLAADRKRYADNKVNPKQNVSVLWGFITAAAAINEAKKLQR